MKSLLRSRKAPTLFSLLLVALLAANYFAPFSDLDFTWQIRTGEQIVRTGQLRPPESFSYTIEGRGVPEFEWLYEVILWSIWSAFGFGGLKFLRVVLVFTPLLVVGLRLRKEGVRWYGIAVSIVVAILVVSPSWNLRPLFCTSIGLLLVAGWLHDHCTGRRPLTWWLPTVMLFWANLHPGVIAGQGLLLGAIVCEWANRALKINSPLAAPACWRLTIVGGLGLIATFISPDPIGRLLYPFLPELAHPIQQIFVEMRPAYSVIFRPPFTILLAYVVFGMVAATVVLRFRNYRLWEIALLIGVTALANLAVRSLQDWLLVMLMLGVPQVSALVRELRARASDRLAGSSFWPALAHRFLRANHRCEKVVYGRAFRFQWTWPIIVMSILGAVSLIPPLARQMPIQNSIEWPVAALDWLENGEWRGRFFANPDFGSYLGWRLRDRARVYVDTRGFFFPPELIEDSHYVAQLGPQWQTRMQRVLDYGTDYFLLETQGGRGQLWQVLRPYVDRPLYLDEQAVLLSREQVNLALPQIGRIHDSDLFADQARRP
jgi:hypothetical protein